MERPERGHEFKLKARESGAGRFTDFLLPSLTFAEYLDLTGAAAPPTRTGPRESVVVGDVAALNAAFVEYANFWGYAEAALNPAIRANPGRFIKSDIIDKVLLRDLPQLYGIGDIQELNRLFTSLAWNTSQEVSLDELSKRSGVAKNTIKQVPRVSGSSLPDPGGSPDRPERPPFPARHHLQGLSDQPVPPIGAPCAGWTGRRGHGRPGGDCRGGPMVP